ncbi:hypothetical protein PV350_00105 [Streptomyces sp. PA03-6a]|nr:hypothetical protein [Streptomyces sp. PA03-6a]
MDFDTAASRHAGRRIGLPLAVVAVTALAAGCGPSEGKPSAARTTSPAPLVVVTAHASPSRSEAEPRGGGTGDAGTAAFKDGVMVREPVLKATGDAFRVGVRVVNTHSAPARIQAVIRLTGPWGYNAVIDVETDVLGYGDSYDGVYTAHDETAGAVIPDRPTVVVVAVTRTRA